MADLSRIFQRGSTQIYMYVYVKAIANKHIYGCEVIALVLRVHRLSLVVLLRKSFDAIIAESFSAQK